MLSDRQNRSLGLDNFWSNVERANRPALKFAANTEAEWHVWRETLIGKLRELLGPDRPGTPLAAEVLEKKTFRKYVREKIVYDTETGVSATAWVLVPRGRLRRRPGLLCLHGHGAIGKDLVAGVAGLNLRHRRHILRSRYNVAEHFVSRGYVCMCPDARGWGERSDGFFRVSAKERRAPFGGTRDPCNVHFLKAQLFGLNLLWLNVWDDMRALDYLAGRADVDGDRIGCAGLSWGGTRTLWLAALDTRVRAATVSCALTGVVAQTVKLANTCGSQLLPGMMRWCDLGDVGALVAPRPILFESGRRDSTFPLEDARAQFSTVRSAFELLGVGDRCEHHVFDGGHRFDGERTYSFIERWLPTDD